MRIKFSNKENKIMANAIKGVLFMIAELIGGSSLFYTGVQTFIEGEKIGAGIFCAITGFLIMANGIECVLDKIKK
jgi:hypothetical protein